MKDTWVFYFLVPVGNSIFFTVGESKLYLFSEGEGWEAEEMPLITDGQGGPVPLRTHLSFILLSSGKAAVYIFQATSHPSFKKHS